MRGPHFRDRKGPRAASQEPVEIPSHSARGRLGVDGKTRATSVSAATCEERATQPDSPRRSRPPGCAAFSPLPRCSSVTDRCGYALSSRLGETKNRQQRGMAGYINRLLRRVIARQEIRAPTLQLRNELLRECELNLGIGLSKYPEEAAQTKRRTIFHYFGVRRVSQFFRLAEGVVQLTKPIDQLVLECVFARQDSPVGDRIAQKVCRKISFFRNDAEKFVIGFHDKALHELAFLRSDRS